jgi:hypothetical protein
VGVKLRRSDPEADEAQCGAVLVSSFEASVEGMFPRWMTTESDMSVLVCGGSFRKQTLDVFS